MKAAEFTNHTKESDWENVTHRRMIARICVLFKAYSGERAWEAISDRLRRPYYLISFDHVSYETNYKRCEMKGIKLLRKSSESAVN